MRRITLMGATALLLMLGVAAQASAQQGPPPTQSTTQQQKVKPKRKPAEQQVRPARTRAKAPPSKQAQHPVQTRPAPPQARSAAQPSHPSGNGQEAATHPAGRSQPVRHSRQQIARRQAQPELRLSSRNDRRIPDARFRARFGSQHRFRIGSPELVGGYSRFQYGVISFGFVQQWPSNWYYTEDVYVEDVGGYYFLCNPLYTGVCIAIVVLP